LFRARIQFGFRVFIYNSRRTFFRSDKGRCGSREGCDVGKLFFFHTVEYHWCVAFFERAFRASGNTSISYHRHFINEKVPTRCVPLFLYTSSHALQKRRGRRNISIYKRLLLFFNTGPDIEHPQQTTIATGGSKLPPCHKSPPTVVDTTTTVSRYTRSTCCIPISHFTSRHHPLIYAFVIYRFDHVCVCD